MYIIPKRNAQSRSEMRAHPHDESVIASHGSQVYSSPTLPQGKSGALVGVATTSGVNAAVVARINDTWTVMAFIGKTWQGPITGGAQILATW